MPLPEFFETTFLETNDTIPTHFNRYTETIFRRVRQVIGATAERGSAYKPLYIDT